MRKLLTTLFAIICVQTISAQTRDDVLNTVKVYRGASLQTISKIDSLSTSADAVWVCETMRQPVIAMQNAMIAFQHHHTQQETMTLANDVKKALLFTQEEQAGADKVGALLEKHKDDPAIIAQQEMVSKSTPLD